MEIISKIFEYPFAFRAVIVGILLCFCSALVGVNLVLKRYSMLGDGLSHVSFGAAAIALALGFAPLRFSLPLVIIAAFLLLRINENGKIKGDAAISIVSTSALAIGITVANLTTGMNTDISNYMFGSILALSKEDVVFTIVVSIFVIMLYVLFYNKIFSSTFDEKFAVSSGVNVKFYNGLSAVLTAVTVVVGMRIMGALLISSIITFPVLSAMRVTKRYRSTVILSVIISVFAFLIGILLSFAFDIPAGAAVVLTNLAFFLILNCFS